MSTISESEAKARFDELLDRVLEGEEFIITRYEKPVARLIAEGVSNLADIRRGADGLQALQMEIEKSERSKKPLRWRDFKSAIQEGRR